MDRFLASIGGAFAYRPTGCFGPEPPAKVAALAALPPGDFAAVRRKGEVLGSLLAPPAANDEGIRYHPADLEK